uniref:Methyltransferase type 12 n=1 Tax=Chlorobium chlorochromatii (strain CaD3) TaxID=340177 RepID=Q3APR4_CHLCH
MTDLSHETLLRLHSELAAEYELAESSYQFGGKPFSFLHVRDSYALLDRISPEEFVKDEQMPYWAEIWPSASALSTFFMDEVALEGKHLLELGAGIGVVSIVAAWRGAQVVATDYSIEALRFIRYNSLKNSVALTAERLDWRQVQRSDRFDYVVAADVLYERVNLLPVVLALDKLLKADGVAFIADPRRRMAEQFVELATENGFVVTTHARRCQIGEAPVMVNIHQISRL